MFDFFRIACAVPDVTVGDTDANSRAILDMWRQADDMGADAVVFPELCVTGFTCGDLFFQSSLINSAAKALGSLASRSSAFECAAVVGLPVEQGGSLYDCAAVIRRGRIEGLVPRTGISASSPYGEDRYFSSGSADLSVPSSYFGISERYEIPLRADMIFGMGEADAAVVIGDDLDSPAPFSREAALAGAQVILNPLAVGETAGRSALRRESLKVNSAALRCVYASCCAGCGESTTDFIFPGRSFIAENGAILAENRGAVSSGRMIAADADVGLVRHERLASSYFRCGSGFERRPVHDRARSDGSLRKVDPSPFIPDDEKEADALCLEIFEMQAQSLKKRLAITGARPVIGVSGGLDSTLALLVCVKAVDLLGRPASEVHALTLPGFGTSGRTYNNAVKLMEMLGVTRREISIAGAVTGHFKDIGHDPEVRDGTYENAQARERTQILMDYAGDVGGMVIGTGDLSELALGWCTYNGDHMSMYGVNGSLPKTLVRRVVAATVGAGLFPDAAAVLSDVCDTPISPELLPPDEQGRISQSTEEIVGPYELHDFFIYNMLRYGFGPEKLLFLAEKAWGGRFDRQTILKWLRFFCKKFFSQQFKRSCSPDGAGVTAISLSPRAGLRMPSDASASVWLRELDRLG